MGKYYIKTNFPMTSEEIARKLFHIYVRTSTWRNKHSYYRGAWASWYRESDKPDHKVFWVSCLDPHIGNLDYDVGGRQGDRFIEDRVQDFEIFARQVNVGEFESALLKMVPRTISEITILKEN